MNLEDFTPDQIIWSADVPRSTIKSVIEVGALPKHTVIKLDRLFFEDNEKDFIDFCRAHEYNVFADAKIIEIPTKTLEIAKTYLSHSPWMLNVMAGACSTGICDSADENELDALKRFADLCLSKGTKPCGVTVLTSKTEALCGREFGGRLPLEQVLVYVEMLIAAGFTDVVCSPKEAQQIRQEFGNNISINTPGVRLPDSAGDDQARTDTPRGAFEAGVDRIVIGRPITGDGNVEGISERYEKIIENIQGVSENPAKPVNVAEKHYEKLLGNI